MRTTLGDKFLNLYSDFIAYHGNYVCMNEKRVLLICRYQQKQVVVSFEHKFDKVIVRLFIDKKKILESMSTCMSIYAAIYACENLFGVPEEYELLIL